MASRQRTAARAERDGASAAELVGHRLRLAEGRYEIHGADGELLYAGIYRINATAEPAQIEADTTQLVAQDSPKHNGYLLGGFGSYGTDYVERAVISQIGLGAFLPQQAIYAMTWSDASQQALASRHHALSSMSPMHCAVQTKSPTSPPTNGAMQWLSWAQSLESRHAPPSGMPVDAPGSGHGSSPLPAEQLPGGVSMSMKSSVSAPASSEKSPQPSRPSASTIVKPSRMPTP